MERNTIRSLLSIIFLDQVTFTIAFPLLTLMFFDNQSRLFTADTTYAVRSMWYGLCVSLPYFLNIFISPLLSALSDEFGRKKILMFEIFNALLFSLSVGLGIYLGVLWLIFLGFVVRGAFSRTNPTALAIIGDTVSKENKVLYMGYLQFAISVGACLGPILGGQFANHYFFTHLNFSLPFFIAATLAVFNTLLTFFIMRETLKKRESKPWGQFNFQAIKYVLTHPDVLRISLVLLLIQLSWSTYYQFMPPILKTIYGFGPHQLGWFIGMIAFWLAMATGIGIKFLQRFFGVRQMLLISVYLVLGGLIITLLACAKMLPADAIVIWAGAFPVAAGDVIAYSCLTALYSNVVAQDMQGKVMGVGFVIASTAWAFTGFIGGLLMGITPLLPLMVAPVGIIAALMLVRTEFGRKLVLSYELL